MPTTHAKIIVAGGGVAAAEALLGLHSRLGPTVSLDLLAPEPQLVHRPSLVAAPFGLVGPEPVPLARIADSAGATVRAATLKRVRPGRTEILTGQDEVLHYDMLVVATGARWVDPIPGVPSFRGAAGVAAVRELLDGALHDPCRPIAFVAPELDWTLPAYELALLSARWLRERGVRRPPVTVVAVEPEPLAMFGPEAGVAIRELLAAAGVELQLAATPTAADLPHAVTLQSPAGPQIPGLPSDDRGFLPTDAFGAVAGVRRVYAAGDVTSFPVKQGGLATQQADAVADAIAHELGALRDPKPFRPVLRGLLLTGDAPLYLRAELSWAHGRRVTQLARRLPRRGIVSRGALWWPPAKLAGRQLAAWFAASGETLVEQHTSPRAPDHEEALSLALLMADLAAEEGDLTGALHALDAAANVSGGVLPTAAAERRAAWTAQVQG